MSKHTPTPWGIEYTKTHLWIGPLRNDGSGKCRDVVCSIACDGLSTEALNKVIDNAHLIVHGANALADRDPSKLVDLENAVEEAAVVFDEWSMPTPAAHLRATLAAFRKETPHE